MKSYMKRTILFQRLARSFCTDRQRSFYFKKRIRMGRTASMLKFYCPNDYFLFLGYKTVYRSPYIIAMHVACRLAIYFTGLYILHKIHFFTRLRNISFFSSLAFYPRRGENQMFSALLFFLFLLPLPHTYISLFSPRRGNERKGFSG